MITGNVIYRVFRLKVGLETGTVFTIEEEGREYLVTARHIAHSLSSNPLSYGRKLQPLSHVLFALYSLPRPIAAGGHVSYSDPSCWP